MDSPALLVFATIYQHNFKRLQERRNKTTKVFSSPKIYQVFFSYFLEYNHSKTISISAVLQKIKYTYREE
jgi:hypothetical protein